MRVLLTAHFLLGLAALATGLFGLYVAFMPLGVTLWYVAFFAFISAVCGLLGIGLGLGKFTAGRAIAAVSLAGAIGVGAVLAWNQAKPNLAAAPFWREATQIWLITQLGLAASFIVLAAIDALFRKPTVSLPMIARAAALAVPLAGLVTLGWWLYAGSGLTAMPDVVRILYAVLGGAGVLFLIAAIGHCVIRAFELAPPPAAPRTLPTSQPDDAQP